MGECKSISAHQFIINAVMKKTNPFFLLAFLLVIVACGEDKPDVTQSKPANGIKNGAMPDITPQNPYASVDISPMDMSYFPVDFPKMKMANATIASPVARVIYSRPHLGKRRLFNDILKYGETWRLGANESTEITFYKPVTIQGKKIPAGRYILYAIPHPDKWTIVLNSNIDTWGLQQDPAKDVQRFDIPILTNQPMLEYFTIVFEKAGSGANMVMGWETIAAKLPITF
jgi:hypothetical protein